MGRIRSISRDRFMVVAAVALLIGLITLGVGLGVGLYRANSSDCSRTYEQKGNIMSQSSESTLPTASTSLEGNYRYAAIASDSKECSTIGIEILAREHGTAVDATIATLLCVCVVHAQSCGVGGGDFMTIYNRANRTTSVIMAREMAPSGADELMFTRPHTSSSEGGLAIGIPGQIKGMWTAWQLGGRVSWKRLFQPTIKMCRNGFSVTSSLAEAIVSETDFIKRHPTLKAMVTNTNTGDFYKEGDTMVLPKLADTLEVIAEKGSEAFYNGDLSKNIASDIRDAGGIISLSDLANYTVVVKDSIDLTLSDGSIVYAPPPPSGGVIYEMIINILQGYNFNSTSMAKENAVLTWHRVVEAFKFAFGKRSLFGDADVEDQAFKDNIESLIINITSVKYAESIRSEIWDNQTHDTDYYEPAFHLPPDYGTSHLSVLAPNGDAVSCTSTINTHFGSKVVGRRTGILFNNQMDDFSTPNTMNYYGIPASPKNFIKPWKRPFSSMTPVIITDSSGNVRLITGGSGGTHITTSVALNTIETLWFGMGVKESIDYPRIHHQLAPAQLMLERGFPAEYVKGLARKGHRVVMSEVAGSRVNAILQTENTKITANSDYRKNGGTDGY